MTRLIQEASLDDRFNTAMGSIQRSIETLEKLVSQMEKEGLRPVSSQLMQVWHAHEDLEKLYGKIEILKKK